MSCSFIPEAFFVSSVVMSIMSCCECTVLYILNKCLGVIYYISGTFVSFLFVDVSVSCVVSV